MRSGDGVPDPLHGEPCWLFCSYLQRVISQDRLFAFIPPNSAPSATLPQKPRSSLKVASTMRWASDALRSRTEGRQTTEVAIAVASLNRMLELGRPEYVRLT
jgi:hypothetical protein